jgi:hypothetical protein
METGNDFHHGTESHRERPNGLAFSCRERAWRRRQKTNDLAREAVNCNAGLGGNFGIFLN